MINKTTVKLSADTLYPESSIPLQSRPVALSTYHLPCDRGLRDDVHERSKADHIRRRTTRPGLYTGHWDRCRRRGITSVTLPRRWACERGVEGRRRLQRSKSRSGRPLAPGNALRGREPRGRGQWSGAFIASADSCPRPARSDQWPGRASLREFLKPRYSSIRAVSCNVRYAFVLVSLQRYLIVPSGNCIA